MTLLQVHNLQVRLPSPHGPVTPVRQLNLKLEKGQKIGWVGESGCGKSMAALALMGLLPEQAQASGALLYQGSDLLKMDEAALCQIRGNRIAMVFQEPMTALNPLHTVGHQVAEPLMMHRGMGRTQALDEAWRLLDRVGITDARRRLHDHPHQFSGGQRQRITIAMALACGPDLLIADEPTTALDVTVAAQILALIQELVQESHMSLILISHDLALVSRHVDEVMVMYGGTVVEQGPARTVFMQPAHPYTRGLMASRPQAMDATSSGGRRPRLPAIAGSVPELHRMPPGCPFADRCPQVQTDCAMPPPVQPLAPGHSMRCVIATP